MKQMVLSVIERLKNKGTVLAIVGGVITIAIQFGFKVESEKVMLIVETICGILIGLGVMNNPVGNTKAYVPGVSDQLVEKKAKVETKEEVKAEVNATEVVENIVKEVE